MRLLSSLTNRIFLATALLVLFVVAVAVYRINVAVTEQAENELRRGLEEAARLLEESRATLFEHFVREARLVGDLSNLKAAVTTGDSPTVQPIVEAYQQRIAAELLVVTDPAGRILARAGRLQIDPTDAAVRRTIATAAKGGDAVGVWPHADGPIQAVSVPSFLASPGLLPELVGTVTLGLSLDAEAARRFKALTNSDIAFAVGDRIAASTLPASFDARLVPHIGGAGIQELQAADGVYVILSRPLAPAAAEGGPALSALIVRSRSERLRFLAAVHRELAAIAVLAVLAATVLSYGVARSVTRPLGAITATMREMAATGDLTLRIPLSRSGRFDDEDARLLVTTFNAMTASIAQFQREAAERERLSSLGRLSTVVAHEIRNPLMIIKTTLRALKRPGVSAEAIQGAVFSIDEEVARLNRLVADVLDFAKPIRYDRAPADLNAVCRDAARASAPEGQVAPIALVLDEGLPLVDTDAERVRLALVNILTNARQAVAAREPAPDGCAISLSTRRAPHEVIISVHDRGAGIAAADLPHVFGPFFTTRRTGTGLGLAISRNIVEGLGGTIRIESQPGAGTTVTIALPLEAAPARA